MGDFQLPFLPTISRKVLPLKDGLVRSGGSLNSVTKTIILKRGGSRKPFQAWPLAPLPFFYRPNTLR